MTILNFRSIFLWLISISARVGVKSNSLIFSGRIRSYFLWAVGRVRWHFYTKLHIFVKSAILSLRSPKAENAVGLFSVFLWENAYMIGSIIEKKNCKAKIKNFIPFLAFYPCIPKLPVTLFHYLKKINVKMT